MPTPPHVSFSVTARPARARAVARAACALLCAFNFVLAPALPLPARAEQVDRTLYIVGDRLICASDVALERDILRIDPSPIPPLARPNDRYPVEERLIDAAILRARAGDSAVYQPSSSEVQRRWERFQAGWSRVEDLSRFLTAWGLTDVQMQGMLYSRMVIERYVQRHVGLAVQQAKGSSDDYTAAYDRWMEGLRQSVLIRRSGG